MAPRSTERSGIYPLLEVRTCKLRSVSVEFEMAIRHRKQAIVNAVLTLSLSCLTRYVVIEGYTHVVYPNDQICCQSTQQLVHQLDGVILIKTAWCKHSKYLMYKPDTKSDTEGR